MGWLLLAGRIGVIGVERVLLKSVGAGGNAICTTFLFFALASAMATPFGIASPLSLHAREVAMLSGIIYTFAFVLFVHALALGEVSKVAPIGAMSYVFLLLMAAALGREPVGLPQVVGTVLIVWGVTRLQWHRLPNLKEAISDRAVLSMLAYALLTAAHSLVDQHGGIGAHPYAYAWTMFTTVSVVLALWITFRRMWPQVLSLLRRRSLIALGSAITNVLSYAWLVALFDDFPVTLIQPSVGLSYLVSAYLAKLAYGEDLRGRIWPALIVIVGTALILWRR